MDKEIWKPNVTVAAVVERQGKFLLVEEMTAQGLLFNQPAGHLEQDESLVAACSRETLEETAWQFTAQELVGIYQWPRQQGDVTYLRFAFCGALGAHHAERQLDSGIVRAVWMSAQEVETSRQRHRSPLVWQCVQDYLAGKRYPLEVITHYS